MYSAGIRTKEPLMDFLKGGNQGGGSGSSPSLASGGIRSSRTENIYDEQPPPDRLRSR